MKQIILKNFLYPDGIYSPQDMIDYLCAVYGIEEKSLLEETIKQIAIFSQKSEYSGWFEDYYDEWVLKQIEL